MCCGRGIRLSFLTPDGSPIAMLSAPMLTAAVQTRREPGADVRAFLERIGMFFRARAAGSFAHDFGWLWPELGLRRR